jgi:hypothetical protein
MHQTTVRFGPDLWAELEREAANSGVSAAQYVREATLTRLAYSAAQRGEAVVVPPARSPEGAVAAAHSGAREAQSGSAAVWAQARLARERARTVREAARAMQGRQA